MKIEEATCTYCSTTFKVNVPDGKKIIDVYRDDGSLWDSGARPHNCPSCGKTHGIKLVEE